MTTDELMGGSNLCGDGVGVCAPPRILKTLFFYYSPGKNCAYTYKRLNPLKNSWIRLWSPSPGAITIITLIEVYYT